MNSLLLTIALTLFPAQERERPVPDPQAVAAAVEALEAAYKQHELPATLAALGSASQVVDATVIKLIARSLAASEPELQRAAFEALRRMPHPDALKQMESALTRDKALRKDPETFAAALRAIGQHGDPQSLSLLGKDLFVVRDKGAIRARILALGNIRQPASVECLMSFMKSAGRAKVAPYMQDFRMSLMILTGADQGKSVDLWLSWWNDNKKQLEVPAEPGLLPEEMQRSWDSFWGNERKYERKRKRGERGQDPDEDPEQQPGESSKASASAAGDSR